LRAQRKKYLEKLKSKLQKYKSISVKVSIKIQASVRFVAEKNKRFRVFLQSWDIVSLKIDTTIKILNVEAQTPLKVSILETKLNTKKSCIEDIYKTGFNSRQFNTLNLFQLSTESRDNICKQLLILVLLITTTIYSVSLLESSALENRLSSSSIAILVFLSINSSSNLIDYYKKKSLDLSLQISSNNNTILYIFAVNIITSIRVDISVEDIKTKLEYNKDIEYKIDNSIFFTIIDRYIE